VNLARCRGCATSAGGELRLRQRRVGGVEDEPDVAGLGDRHEALEEAHAALEEGLIVDDERRRLLGQARVHSRHLEAGHGECCAVDALSHPPVTGMDAEMHLHRQEGNARLPERLQRAAEVVDLLVAAGTAEQAVLRSRRRHAKDSEVPAAQYLQ
jgi:hypothetical protein